MLGWLKGFFGFLSAISQWLRDRQLIHAGELAQEAKQVQETLDVVKKATTARDEVRHADSTITATEQLPDDGFRRD